MISYVPSTSTSSTYDDSYSRWPNETISYELKPKKEPLPKEEKVHVFDIKDLDLKEE